MKRPVRIGNVSGFYGDRRDGIRSMLDGGPVDVITGDWLAELTMLIMARTKARRPDGGYGRTFIAQLHDTLGEILDRGIRVVVNAGGLDPTGCATAVRKLGAEFDAIYTAQDIGSYKPSPANFEYLLTHLRSDLGLSPSDVLHTAQSLSHDHVHQPNSAKAMGRT